MGDNFCLLTTLKDAVVFVQLLWERQSTINDISVWRIQKKNKKKKHKKTNQSGGNADIGELRNGNGKEHKFILKD